MSKIVPNNVVADFTQPKEIVFEGEIAGKLRRKRMTNFLDSNYDKMENELDSICADQVLRIEINKDLEEAVTELTNLKNQYSQKDVATLLELCKNNVIDTITSQFGLASLFINSQDGGNVTTTHNFEQGITATNADEQKYNSWQEMSQKDWQDVRKGTGYDKPLPGKRKQAFKTQDVIIDEYTGRPLPKDGRAQLDHIVSASEIENKASANLFMTPEERAKMATNDKNLAWTEGSANQSKGNKKMEDWLNKKDTKTGQTKAEKYGIDEKRAMGKDKDARKFINKTINTATAKKYTKELLSTGGKDATMMAAYSALGVVLRDLAQGIMIEVRLTFEQKGTESFREIFTRFKNRLQEILTDLKNKWKDVFKGSLEAAIISFFSNIVVFVINLFFTTLKKIVSMIRAGFVSLCQAVKLLTNPPADMPKDEVHYQALKILTAGIIGAASLGLSDVIEKGLQAIPGLQPLMMFPIPSFGKEQRTVSDVVAVTLSALAGGLLTTIVLYFLDKCRAAAKHDKLQIQLITQSGVVVQCEVAKTWCTMEDAYKFFKMKVFEICQIFQESGEELENSFVEVKQASVSRENAMSKLRSIYNN